MKEHHLQASQPLHLYGNVLDSIYEGLWGSLTV